MSDDIWSSKDGLEFSISKNRDWEGDGEIRTAVRMYIAVSGTPSREEIEEKLEDLIGQVLDAY